MWLQHVLSCFSDNYVLPGRTQAFSSYPGSIFSGDDFYILSSGLVRSLYTWHYITEYDFFFFKRESWDYLTAFIFFLSFSVCRLLWKPPLATATLLSGNMFSPLEQSWSGWGTLLQIDSLLLARTGQKSSRSTTVERELVLIIKKKLFDLLTRLQTVLLFSLCW